MESSGILCDLFLTIQTFQSKVTELEDEVEKSRAQSAIAESVPTLQAALEEQQRVCNKLINRSHFIFQACMYSD